MGMIQKGVNQIIAGIGAAAVAGEARKTRESNEASDLESTGYNLAKEGSKLKQDIANNEADKKAFEDKGMQAEQALSLMGEFDEEASRKLHSRENGKFRKKQDIEKDVQTDRMKHASKKIQLQHDMDESAKALESLKKQYQQLSNQKIYFEKRLETFNKRRDKLVKKGYDITEVREENK